MVDSILEARTESSLTASLNDEQRQAVETTQGPVLVLAGAGTGKTRVLTTRIAHILLSRLAFPSEILAVTFTNKAAREMSERVAHLLSSPSPLEGEGRGGGYARSNSSSSTPPPNLPPQGGEGIVRWLGTFHSIGVKIIRRHAEKLGLTPSFTILDMDDQLRLIKAILIEQQIDEKALPPKLFSAIIQSFKDKGLTADKVTEGKEASGAGGHALAVYKLYQARLLQINAVDFGDLILHMLTLFTQFPDVHQEFARKFKYILVDEYQDTNVAQYLWLRLLAMGHKNICCVGDDDQSIYSWRGAEVGNILRFEKDFPDATIIKLECNYRSTPHILAAASAVISHNEGRFGKTLWTNVKEGEKIALKSVWDEAEEARYVGDEIEALQRQKTSLAHMAILVRAGFQTRAFEERFLTMGIPYRVVGGLRFYERAEIRDMIAYIRLICSPNDDLAFERIINVPKRGIGQATMQQLHTASRNPNTSLLNATIHLLNSGVLKGKLGQSLGLFTQNISKWREALAVLPVADVAEKILEESGYRAMWAQEKTPEAQGRVENLKELVRAIGEFESIEAFLEHVSLVVEATTETQGNDMISLMTLHAAKGLEFDVVFLPGWEEGVFPHQRALDESGQKGLEEERRLAYVGITRAKKRLFITHAANRRIYNQWQSSIPSRFIAEIPEAHVDKLSGGAYGSAQLTRSQWGADVAAILNSSPLEGSARISDEARRGVVSDEGTFKIGTRIFHQKFGYGRITAVNGSHLDINFEKAGAKKLLADFVEKC